MKYRNLRLYGRNTVLSVMSEQVGFDHYDAVIKLSLNEYKEGSVLDLPVLSLPVREREI